MTFDFLICDISVIQVTIVNPKNIFLISEYAKTGKMSIYKI